MSKWCKVTFRVEIYLGNFQAVLRFILCNQIACGTPEKIIICNCEKYNFYAVLVIFIHYYSIYTMILFI